MKTKNDWDNTRKKEQEKIVNLVNLHIKSGGLEKTIVKELKDLADKYHLELKKVGKIQINDALNQFQDNGKGYSKTINRLYSSL